MEKFRDDVISYVKQNDGGKELVYTSDFETELSKLKICLLGVKKCIDLLRQDNVIPSENVSVKQRVVENDQVRVTLLGLNEQTENIKYFKISTKAGDSEYFLKYIDLSGSYTNREYVSTGPVELLEMDQLRSDIKDIVGVRVLDYKLGYVDGDDSYCVAKYEPALRTPFKDDMFTDDRNDELKQRYYRLLSAIGEKVNSHGRRYADFGGNIAYDKEKDEFIIFDLYLVEGSMDRVEVRNK